MRHYPGVAGLMLGVAIFTLPQSSLAAPRCVATAELDQIISPAKGYIRLGRGTTNDGTTIDVFVAPMTASWIAVARLSPNRSCIITEGKNWQGDGPFSAPALPAAPQEGSSS